MIIETRRIIIRPMEKRDEDDYVLLECSFSFMKSLTESLPMNTTKQIVLDTLSEGKIEVYSLDNRLDGQYVGYLCIKSKENGFELGINLMQKYRGQGYGPEAIKALTDYLFQSRHITSLTVHIEKKTTATVFMCLKKSVQNIRMNQWSAQMYWIFRFIGINCACQLVIKMPVLFC